MGERVGFVEYKGKLILLEDFSNIDRDEDSIIVLKSAQHIIQAMPPKSVLVLVDLANIHFTPILIWGVVDVVKSDTLFVSATAVVGVTGWQSVIIRAVSILVQRELVTFSSREEAMEWLVQ